MQELWVHQSRWHEPPTQRGVAWAWHRPRTSSASHMSYQQHLLRSSFTMHTPTNTTLLPLLPRMDPATSTFIGMLSTCSRVCTQIHTLSPNSQISTLIACAHTSQTERVQSCGNTQHGVNANGGNIVEIFLTWSVRCKVWEKCGMNIYR